MYTSGGLPYPGIQKLQGLTTLEKDFKMGLYEFNPKR